MTGERGRISRRLVVVAVVVVVVIGAVVGGIYLFGTKTPAKAAGVDNAAATSTATIAQRSLSAQTNVSATLGYAGTYSVVNQATGSFSQLPTVGEVIEPGEVLYAVGGQPVVLLVGSTPAYRTMVAGISGPDAAELNNALVALGYGAATLQGSPIFSAATAAALVKLQAHLGIAQTGVLTMDEVIFLPSAARITTVSATLGAAAQVGATVATATSTTREVVVALDATQQASVKVGDQVTITLARHEYDAWCRLNRGHRRHRTVGRRPRSADDADDRSRRHPNRPGRDRRARPGSGVGCHHHRECDRRVGRAGRVATCTHRRRLRRRGRRR